MNILLKFIRIIKRWLFTIFVKLRARECGKLVYANEFSILNKRTILGNNVHFNGMRITGNGTVIIGDNFHSGHDCLIITSNHDYDYGEFIPYGNKSVDKDVVIEDNVWLGDRVIILGGIHLGEGCIIQAGSVVVKDINAFEIAGGHPCQPFKIRNREHYNKLKAEKKFF